MLRCPRRFFYRYRADRTPHLNGLVNLMSVRELGGHAVHSVLANAVRRIAGGERISDQTDVVREALGLFNLPNHSYQPSPARSCCFETDGGEACIEPQERPGFLRRARPERLHEWQPAGLCQESV